MQQRPRRRQLTQPLISRKLKICCFQSRGCTFKHFDLAGVFVYNLLSWFAETVSLYICGCCLQSIIMMLKTKKIQWNETHLDTFVHISCLHLQRVWESLKLLSEATLAGLQKYKECCNPFLSFKPSLWFCCFSSAATFNSSTFSCCEVLSFNETCKSFPDT